MRRVSDEELKEILKKHKMWLQGREGGVKANLTNAVLTGVDLSCTDLRYVILNYANLRNANLTNANLIGVSLTGAILRDAILRGAILDGADLSYTSLRNADLTGAILRNVNLTGAILDGADLSDTIINHPINCPEEGSFIGFKRCGIFIVKLQITEDSLRSSATSRKCRCSKAKVLSITNLDGTDSGLTKISSTYDNSFIYTIGETVEVHNFDTNRWNECAPGIHFFITRQEAIDY